ncbi:hypothetical protein B9479_000430 [Cryptococcus floricola]|uniref:Uncharacterized protein n=1 Tax=Cryptococcus floricola TaxID=2591691 RepID=A0A5D3B8Q6_9TREE|nr:hypothetical protein B9479_000430 [Cryptococcus floricola]
MSAGALSNKKDLKIIPKPDTVTVDFTVPSECSLVQEAQAYLHPVSSTASQIAEALSIHIASVSPSRGAGGSSNPYELTRTRDGCTPVMSLLLNSEHHFASLSRVHSWLKDGTTNSSMGALMPESITTKDEARVAMVRKAFIEPHRSTCAECSLLDDQALVTKSQTIAVDMASTLGLQQYNFATEIRPDLAQLEESKDDGWAEVKSFVSGAITNTDRMARAGLPGELVDLSSRALDQLQEQNNPERSVPFPVDTLRAFGDRKGPSVLTRIGRFL